MARGLPLSDVTHDREQLRSRAASAAADGHLARAATPLGDLIRTVAARVVAVAHVERDARQGIAASRHAPPARAAAAALPEGRAH